MWAFAVVAILVPLAVAATAILAQTKWVAMLQARRNLRVGAMSLLVVALAALAAVVAAYGAGELPEVAAAFVAMIVGCIGGAVVGLLTDWPPRNRSDAERTEPRGIGGPLLALILMVAFGFGCCWLGFGVGALVHR